MISKDWLSRTGQREKLNLNVIAPETPNDSLEGSGVIGLAKKSLFWFFQKVLQKNSNELFGQPNRPAFRDFPLWDKDDTIQPLDVGYRKGGDDLTWATLFSWGQILNRASGLKSQFHPTFIDVVEWVCRSWMRT